MSEEQIQSVVAGYRTAAERAVAAGFDAIEVQGGHGYLVSQFLTAKINRRGDRYGEDRLLFAREVLAAVRAGAPKRPLILRISGNEMSPEFGIAPSDLAPLLDLAAEAGIVAVHVGMGSSCFSPPWYFHHGSLPEKPQTDALAWVRTQTALPLIVAGRMGRRARIQALRDQGLADFVAVGRPLLADPDLIDKWARQADEDVAYCGYCLQGCLHRLKSGEPLGCNLNPETGAPPLEKTATPVSVLVLKTLWPVPEGLIRDKAAPFRNIVVAEMNLGQYVRELERLLPDKPIRFAGRMNGTLLTPNDIQEAMDHD